MKDAFNESKTEEQFWEHLYTFAYQTLTDITTPEFAEEAKAFVENPCDYTGRDKKTMDALRGLVLPARDIETNTKMIRFITSDYKELFQIPDGGSIVVTRPEGEEYIAECKYLDETHFSANGNCYHICQFAEIQERNGATVKPEAEPEINGGYRVIQRNAARNKVFKLAVNPNAVLKYVTWQSYRDNLKSNDWGHYWNDKSTAQRDLFLRTDAERTGKSYDHTTLIKPKKERNDAR